MKKGPSAWLLFYIILAGGMVYLSATGYKRNRKDFWFYTGEDFEPKLPRNEK
jgi:hypothetical protein